MKAIGDRLQVGAHLLILIGMVVLLFQQSGPFGAPLHRWWREHRTQRVLHSEWVALRGEGSVLSAHGGEKLAIVEFSDYECPFCRDLHPSLEAARASGVAIAVRHLPIAGHRYAFVAAAAAICAESQGYFDNMNRFLMTTEAWRKDSADWGQIAKEVGVPDVAKFSSCMMSDLPVRRIQEDIKAAERLSISGTPSLFTRERQLGPSERDSVSLRLLASRGSAGVQ